MQRSTYDELSNPALTGKDSEYLISSSPSFDTEKFQLPRLPIVAR